MRSFYDDYIIERRSFDSFDVADNVFDNRDAINQIKTITDFNAVDRSAVSYPIADDGNGNDNSRAAHQWFTSNRTQNGRFRFMLPPTTAAEHTLPAMTINGIRAGDVERTVFKPRYRQDENRLELIVGSDYTALLVDNFDDKYGNSYFKISINGTSIFNGKTLKLPKKYLKGKKIGDSVSVNYSGINEKGQPRFFINY